MATAQAELKSITAMPIPEVVNIEDSSPEVLREQILAISSDKLRGLLEEEAKLRSKVEELSSMKGEETKLKIAKADLANVRAELMKRGEDMSSMAAAISAHAESFGHYTIEAYQDTVDDIRNREAAEKRIVDAQKAVGAAEAKIADLDLEDPTSSAAKAVAELKGSWDPRVMLRVRSLLEELEVTRQSNLAKAQSDLSDAETEVEDSTENRISVYEQIEIDKRTRVQNMSLEETYQFIADLVSASVKILNGDIGEYKEAIVRTNKSLSGAIQKRRETSDKLRTAQDDLATKTREKDDIDRDMGDFTDRTDPKYQELSVKSEGLAAEIAQLTSEVQLQEGVFSDMDLAVKENQASIAALTMQERLAQRQMDKFRAIERTARDIGENLVLMVKGISREGIMESLDKGTNKMTVAVFDMANKIKISAARQINDMGERRIEVLEELDAIDKAADGVLAEEIQRHEAVADKMRTGYSEQGLDIEGMSTLAAAAELLGVTPEDKAAQADEVY